MKALRCEVEKGRMEGVEGVGVAGRRPVEEEMNLGEGCSLHIYLLFF